MSCGISCNQESKRTSSYENRDDIGNVNGYSADETNRGSIRPGKYKRTQEIFCTVFSIALTLAILTYLYRDFTIYNAAGVLTTAVLGLTTADLVMGVVHWVADRWISQNVPVIGEILVKPFRLHDRYPSAIIRHTFIHTNSILLTLTAIPLLLHASSLALATPEEIHQSYTWHCYLFFTVLFVGFSNQFHKWSHIKCNTDLPWYVNLMLRLYLLPSYHHHDKHHVDPFDSCYCITSGWCNYPLEVCQFWYRADRVLEKLTGYPPNYNRVPRCL